MSNQLPSWINNYVSLPYNEVNCFSLLQLVYHELYHIEIPGILEQRDLIKTGFWVDVTDLEKQTGDVILFQDNKLERHVAIWLNSEMMLHADQKCGASVIERHNSRLWKSRKKSIYRCKMLN